MRRLIRQISDTWLGDRLKVLSGFRPPKHVRPIHMDATVSDLFLWRIGGGWETRFDLLNMPSLVTPEKPEEEHATLVFFDDVGKELHRETRVLPPFKVTRLTVADVLGDAGIFDANGIERIGTFSVFHAMGRAGEKLTECRSYLTERGYVGYRRAGDPLWSYSHGNTYVLAKRSEAAALFSLTAHTRGSYVYRPQLLLDDAPGFGLAFANPLPRSAPLTVDLMDKDRNVLETIADDVPGYGVLVIDRSDQAAVEVRPALVEARSSAQDWRPTVFKYHSSHFDVLHS